LASDSEILDGQSSLSEFKEADNDTSLPIDDPLINDQPINESSVASSSESKDDSEFQHETVAFSRSIH
jgi:hypothetical protein